MRKHFYSYLNQLFKINKKISILLGDIGVFSFKDSFSFEIIEICDSKFALAYREAKIQFEEEVLLRDDYYNGIINLRVSKPKRYLP